MLFRLSLCALICFINGFNPFSDDDLYAINWAGPADTAMLTLSDKLEIVTVQTDEDEKYQCILPESQESIDASRKDSYHGPKPEELMESLFTQASCSYRIESYWTYELCHGRHIKQYHENKELGLQSPRLQEFYLGKIETASEKRKREREEGRKQDEADGIIQADIQYPEETETTPEKPKKPEPQTIKSVKLDGIELPYFSVNMTYGTVCDLTGRPRVSHVKYICQPTGRGEIYLLKETSSCEYDIIVLTAALCSHPMFKPKDPPVGKINCHAIGGSPRQPKQLTSLERDSGFMLEPEEDPIPTPPLPDQLKKSPPTEVPTRHTPMKPGQEATPYRTETVIGIQTDKQLLRDFLNGDYCLHGGGGWWRHEFCYKKYAKQYHEEAGVTTSIYLGYWDQSKHLDWLEKYPSKRPKQQPQRKQLSHYYSGGDVCDLSGQHRYTEVKLKCLNKPDQPHAVSIYLIEPKPCEYILGVESPIFCDLLDKADENGLLDHVKV